MKAGMATSRLFPLKDWRAAGLNVPSGVKAQLATVEERLRKMEPFDMAFWIGPKKLKKDIALAGVFDRLRPRFQTEGGTV